MAIQILFTAIALVAMLGCFLAVTRSDRTEARCNNHADAAEEARNALLEDRHRVTALERDVAALRRELRKLAGKFYATLAQLEGEPPDDDDDDEPERLGYGPIFNPRQTPLPLAACENWLTAKQAGPDSEAAKCECLYCMTQRAERAHVRGLLVPRTVGEQASLAKLNAGKP